MAGGVTFLENLYQRVKDKLTDSEKEDFRTLQRQAAGHAGGKAHSSSNADSSTSNTPVEGAEGDGEEDEKGAGGAGSVDGIPGDVQSILPVAAQKLFKAAHDRAKGSGKSDADSRSAGFAAVLRAGYAKGEGEAGKWVKASEVDEDDEDDGDDDKAFAEGSLSARIEQVNSAWYSAHGGDSMLPTMTSDCGYVEEVFESKCVVRKSGKYFEVPYSESGDGTIKFGDPRPVKKVQTYEPISNTESDNAPPPPISFFMGELQMTEPDSDPSDGGDGERDSSEGMVQIFPKCGKYSHPRWGELDVTPEFLMSVKSNFDSRVYQQELPVTLDLEHESKLAGAVAWVKELIIKGKEGMWAKIGFTERGKKMVGEDSYRYFSPEYYSNWIDPATSDKHQNVLTGGALTNRPFYKGMDAVKVLGEGTIYQFVEPQAPLPIPAPAPITAASPVMKTEDGNSYPPEAYLMVGDPKEVSTWKCRVWETPEKKVTVSQLGRAAAALSSGGFRGQPVQATPEEKSAAISKLRSLYTKMGVKMEDMPKHIQGGDKTMGMTEEEVKQFNEMQVEVVSLQEERDGLKTLTEKLQTRIAAMEHDSQVRRFTEIVRGRAEGSDGAAWSGDVQKHVQHLVKLSETFGAESEEVKFYVNNQTEMAKKLKELTGVELGSSAPAEGSPQAIFDSKVRALTEKGKSEIEALDAVAREDPDLYRKVRTANYSKVDD